MKGSDVDHPVSEAGGPGYERRDANPRMLFLIGGGLIVLIFVVLFIVGGVMNLFEKYRPTSGEPPPPATAEAHVVPPEPRLQTDPRLEYERMFAEEDSLLRSYGWVDEKDGIAHIPIDTAIAIIASRGLPFREQREGIRESGQPGAGRNQE